MGKIRIHNMQVHTYNGVHPEEKKLGQRLAIDIELDYPIETAVVHDELHETISYAEVYRVAEQFVHQHQYNLIESVANRLLATLLTTFPTVKGITLRIRKYSVPINGIFDDVEIEVSGAPNHG